jgi:hypothetical protein
MGARTHDADTGFVSSDTGAAVELSALQVAGLYEAYLTARGTKL